MRKEKREWASGREGDWANSPFRLLARLPLAPSPSHPVAHSAYFDGSELEAHE